MVHSLILLGGVAICLEFPDPDYMASEPSTSGCQSQTYDTV